MANRQRDWGWIAARLRTPGPMLVVSKQLNTFICMFSPQNRSEETQFCQTQIAIRNFSKTFKIKPGVCECVGERGHQTDWVSLKRPFPKRKKYNSPRASPNDIKIRVRLREEIFFNANGLSFIHCLVHYRFDKKVVLVFFFCSFNFFKLKTIVIYWRIANVCLCVCRRSGRSVQQSIPFAWRTKHSKWTERWRRWYNNE